MSPKSPKHPPVPDALDLKKLAQAMLEESERHAAELQSLATPNESADQAQERLAQEIAEDQALAQADLAAAEGPEEAAEDDQTALLDLNETQAAIEAVLFISDRPLSAERLREIVQPESLPLFQEALTALMDRTRDSRHGFEVAQVAGGYQLRTKIGVARILKRLARVQTQRLSSGAMESLAIIAYKQPVLKEAIDQVRGVDSSHFLRTLLDRGLIQMAGRSELPGRPILYSTTPAFLELFGLKDLNTLPPLREIEQMVASSEVGPLSSRDEKDPRILAMRKMVEEMRMDRAGALDYDPAQDEVLLQEIRERVQAIPVTTATLEQKDAEAKAQKVNPFAAPPLEVPKTLL